MRHGVNFLIVMLLTISLKAGGVGSYSFNRLQKSDGLSSNFVNSIIRDRVGFLWIATNSGLSRYDGYSFKNYRHNSKDPNSIPENIIVKLQEGADGRIWLKGQRSYYVYDPANDKFISNSAADLGELGVRESVQAIHIDDQKNMWFILQNGKLKMWNMKTSRSTLFSTGVASPVVSVISKRGLAYILYRNGTFDIANYRTRKVVKRLSYDVRKISLSNAQIFVDSHGGIWVYSDNTGTSLLYLKSLDGSWKEYDNRSSNPRLSSDLIRGMDEDHSGKIWIATDHGGVNIIDPATGGMQYLKNSTDDPQSISQNSITCIFKDVDNIMWLGTYKQGVSFYHESVFKFSNISFNDSKKNDSNCFYEDKSGNLWIGTNGGGLIKYNLASGAYSSVNSGLLSSNIIVALSGESNGAMWVGTFMGGLTYISPSGSKRFMVGGDNSKTVTSNSIYSLYKDNDGVMWIGNLQGMLDAYDTKAGTFKHYDVGSILINRIKSYDNHRLLIATSDGLKVFDKKSGKYFKLFKNRQTVVNEANIADILVDKKGLLWIATNEGLFVYSSKNGLITSLDSAAKIRDNNIVTLVEDQDSNVWVGTLDGLYKIRVLPSSSSKITLQAVRFDKYDGLTDNSFNVNSAYITSHGQVVFGTPSGINIFDPRKMRFNRAVHRVVLSEFKLLNIGSKPRRDHIIVTNDAHKEQVVELTHLERGFSITFSSLSYILPQKSRYKYMLEGYEKDWNEVDYNSRVATYTNLNPGKYTFKVYGANSDGVWSVQPTTLTIIINPPFWATWWAYMVYLLLALWGIHKFVEWIIAKEKIKLQEEKERFETRQMLELDEMKLQFFTNISHEIKTPLTLIISPIERLISRAKDDDDRKLLNITHNNAKGLLELVNQLLDFRKLDENAFNLNLSVGDIVAFVKGICFQFNEFALKKEVELRFMSNVKELFIKFDQEKIEKSLTNLISNAFKYSSNGAKVVVKIDFRSNLSDNSGELQIIISDDGIGISEENIDRIFDKFFRGSNTEKISGTGIGLYIANEFVKKHGGIIDVSSKEGKGSTFTVHLPVKDLTHSHLVQEQQVLFGVENIQEVSLPEEAHSEIQLDSSLPTLVLVDDNDDFRVFMRSVLKDSYNIYEATNGEEGWKQISSVIPDIVISDVMMPIMDGIELTKRVQSDITTSHIPIILLTAKVGDESRIEGLESGACDYISKPFNLEVLLLKLDKFVKIRTQNQQTFSTKKEIKSTELEISSLDEILLQKAIDYVESNISNGDLSVEDLSSYLAMSRVHLYKKLVSITGKSPIEFIRLLRLKHAAQLLEKSQLSVSEVAYKVGFNEPKYFRKYFKEEYGVLPSEYKGGGKA